MSSSKFKVKRARPNQTLSYRPAFPGLELAKESNIVETVFAVIKSYGLDVHTWMSEYQKACDTNGGIAPPDFERFLPWNMSAEEIERCKQPTPVDFSDHSTLAYIWNLVQDGKAPSVGNEEQYHLPLHGGVKALK